MTKNKQTKNEGEERGRDCIRLLFNLTMVRIQRRASGPLELKRQRALKRSEGPKDWLFQGTKYLFKNLKGNF